MFFYFSRIENKQGAPYCKLYTTLQVIEKKTTMASSEGSREIEAARLRLAAAKSRVSADTKALQTANESKKSVEEMVAKMLENATNSVNAAQNQLSISEKEVKEAQSMLAAAEKRWEVISIDLDSDNEDEKNTKQVNSKRRKVSLSPQSNNNNTTAARSTSTSNNNNDDNVHQVVVEGCGMPTVNGIYTRGRLYGDTPMYTKPEKESDSPLDTDRIGIIRSATLGGGYKWYIVFLSSGDTASSYFYVSEENADRMVPPENGWKTMGRGYGFRLAIGPAPTCRLLLQNENSIIRSSNISGTSVAAGHQSNTNNGQLDNGMGLQTNNNRASSVSLTALDNSNSYSMNITTNTSASFPNVVDRIAIQNYTSKLNGIYTRVGDLQGAPVYTKEGKEPSTLNCYAILRCRPTVGEQMKWYIGNWGARADGNISFNFLYVSRTHGELLFPPETMWHRKCSDGSYEYSRATCRLILPNDHIVIEGCGNVELNGTYSLNYRNTNDNEIEYKRQGQWNGKVVTFSIYQKYHKYRYKWYVGRSLNATSSSTLINNAIFRSREINDLFPPKDGWEVIGTTRGGLYPGPTFRSTEIKQVTVEGCGLSKFNGLYNRVGDDPQYVKHGQCHGEPETQMIARIDKAWYIGKPGDIGDYKVCVDGRDDHSKIPPKEGWSVIVGKGMNCCPVPKLTWM